MVLQHWVRVCVAGYLFLGLVTTLNAGIMLDRSIIEFRANELPRKDVTVINQGDDIAYVSVEVLEVLNPGTQQEQRLPVVDVDREDITFIATPSKLAIPPGGRKQVRLVNLLPDSNQERVYRINFTPVLAPLVEETGGMGIRIVVAYQVLALVQPQSPVEKLVVKRQGKHIVFDNQGNTYVRITNIEQCNQNKEACDDSIAGKRLYPGNTLSIEVPYVDTPVHYRLTTFKGARSATVKAK